MMQIGLMQLTVASLCYFTIGPRTGKNHIFKIEH